MTSFCFNNECTIISLYKTKFLLLHNVIVPPSVYAEETSKIHSTKTVPKMLEKFIENASQFYFIFGNHIFKKELSYNVKLGFIGRLVR